MENKIDKINIEQNSVMFNGKYHFLNEKDWDKLCSRLLQNNGDDYNIIKIGLDIYIKFNGDLSDLGNDIGLNIGEYINNNVLGYEIEDFISGLYHGVSIIDGSHG
jgi:hypothetical protein